MDFEKKQKSAVKIQSRFRVHLAKRKVDKIRKLKYNATLEAEEQKLKQKEELRLKKLKQTERMNALSNCKSKRVRKLTGEGTSKPVVPTKKANASKSEMKPAKPREKAKSFVLPPIQPFNAQDSNPASDDETATENKPKTSDQLNNTTFDDEVGRLLRRIDKVTERLNQTEETLPSGKNQNDFGGEVTQFLSNKAPQNGSYDGDDSGDTFALTQTDSSEVLSQHRQQIDMLYSSIEKDLESLQDTSNEVSRALERSTNVLSKLALQRLDSGGDDESQLEVDTSMQPKKGSARTAADGTMSTAVQNAINQVYSTLERGNAHSTGSASYSHGGQNSNESSPNKAIDNANSFTTPVTKYAQFSPYKYNSAPLHGPLYDDDSATNLSIIDEGADDDELSVLSGNTLRSGRNSNHHSQKAITLQHSQSGNNHHQKKQLQSTNVSDRRNNILTRATADTAYEADNDTDGIEVSPKQRTDSIALANAADRIIADQLLADTQSAIIATQKETQDTLDDLRHIESAYGRFQKKVGGADTELILPSTAEMTVLDNAHNAAVASARKAEEEAKLKQQLVMQEERLRAVKQTLHSIESPEKTREKSIKPSLSHREQYFNPDAIVQEQLSPQPPVHNKYSSPEKHSPIHKSPVQYAHKSPNQQKQKTSPKVDAISPTIKFYVNTIQNIQRDIIQDNPHLANKMQTSASVSHDKNEEVEYDSDPELFNIDTSHVNHSVENGYKYNSTTDKQYNQNVTFQPLSARGPADYSAQHSHVGTGKKTKGKKTKKVRKVKRLNDANSSKKRSSTDSLILPPERLVLGHTNIEDDLFSNLSSYLRKQQQTIEDSKRGMSLHQLLNKAKHDMQIGPSSHAPDHRVYYSNASAAGPESHTPPDYSQYSRQQQPNANPAVQQQQQQHQQQYQQQQAGKKTHVMQSLHDTYLSTGVKPRYQKALGKGPAVKPKRIVLGGGQTQANYMVVESQKHQNSHQHQYNTSQQSQGGQFSKSYQNEGFSYGESGSAGEGGNEGSTDERQEEIESMAEDCGDDASYAEAQSIINAHAAHAQKHNHDHSQAPSGGGLSPQNKLYVPQYTSPDGSSKLKKPIKYMTHEEIKQLATRVQMHTHAHVHPINLVKDKSPQRGSNNNSPFSIQNALLSANPTVLSPVKPRVVKASQNFQAGSKQPRFMEALIRANAGNNHQGKDTFEDEQSLDEMSAVTLGSALISADSSGNSNRQPAQTRSVSPRGRKKVRKVKKASTTSQPQGEGPDQSTGAVPFVSDSETELGRMIEQQKKLDQLASQIKKPQTTDSTGSAATPLQTHSKAVHNVPHFKPLGVETSTSSGTNSSRFLHSLLPLALNRSSPDGRRKTPTTAVTASTSTAAGTTNADHSNTNQSSDNSKSTVSGHGGGGGDKTNHKMHRAPSDPDYDEDIMNSIKHFDLKPPRGIKPSYAQNNPRFNIVSGGVRK